MKHYNVIQKLFHDIVFSSKLINKSLFEVEKLFYLKNKKIDINANIFITGLPRSGTTSLLNFIYSSNEYASLKYKNMPFILSPNFSKIFHKNNISKKERLHGDGITYDINSPEMFDEFFFNDNDIFVKNEIKNYIKLILLSENKKKYLSKNNLVYQRIDLLSELLPNTNFLITIREPLQHAYSLLNQHMKFIKLQQKDDFVRRYMNYLGHYEFGLNHKPWNYPNNFKNLLSIDYWIEQWILFYDNILNKYRYSKYCNFVIYENLTEINYLKNLIKKVNLKNFNKLNLDYFKNSNKKKVDIEFDKYNYNYAKSIYQKFINIDKLK